MTTIVDESLKPYFLVCEKGKIEVFKIKVRNKANGTQENYNSLVCTKNTLPEALKSLVIDSLGKKKKNKPTKIRDYVNAYRKLYGELKKLLTIDELAI